MKDSGIDWIGEIPASWSVARLKYVLTEPMKYGATESGVDYDDDLFRYIRITDITADGKLKEQGKLSLTYAQANGYILRDNAILFARSGGTVGKSFIYRSTYGKAAFAGYLISAYADVTKVLPEWILYFTNCSAYWEWVHRIFTRATIQNIGADKYSNMPIPVASLPVQDAIVGILDIKCAEIDDLAADIQSQIDTLEQYKRSIITEAVTKGLNPDAEMRDSGIDFVGEIPAHWVVHPLYYYFVERKNKNLFGQETNLLSLSYGCIIRKDINTSEGLLPASFNTYNIIEAGDIIIRPTDLQNDKRSLRTGLSKEHGIITSAYIALKPIRPVNTTYFHYLLHAFDVMKVFYNMGNGVRQGLNFSEFSRLMVFEPTMEEQNTIVDMLEQKCAEVDKVIDDKKKQLETLDAYKKSLIFEYVTGKKQVFDTVPTVTVTTIDPHIMLAGVALKGLGKRQLGKIQLEKVLYLFDYYLGLGLRTQYYRFPHGPYDLSLDSYLNFLQGKGWFRKLSNSPEIYAEGEKYSDFFKEAENYPVLSREKGGIDKIISFVKSMSKTSQVERMATLFAAWNDFLIDGITPSDDQIIREVMDNWTENKANTQYSTWKGSLNKLKGSGIVPKGIGLHTLSMVQKGGNHE